MSHVTVVQVHEGHLRSYGEEVKLRRADLGDAGNHLGDAGNHLGDANLSCDARDRLPDAGNLLSDAGDRLPDAGNLLSDAGNRLGDAGNHLGDAGNLLGDAGNFSSDGNQLRDANLVGDAAQQTDKQRQTDRQTLQQTDRKEKQNSESHKQTDNKQKQTDNKEKHSNRPQQINNQDTDNKNSQTKNKQDPVSLKQQTEQQNTETHKQILSKFENQNKNIKNPVASRKINQIFSSTVAMELKKEIEREKTENLEGFCEGEENQQKFSEGGHKQTTGKKTENLEEFGKGEENQQKFSEGGHKQMTRSFLRGDCLLKARNLKRRTKRSNSIIDQNVGVTGSAVLMKSDPSQHSDSDAESESSLTSSVSSLSDSDSGLSSTIEVGMSPTPHHSTTISIGEENHNSILVHVIPDQKCVEGEEMRGFTPPKNEGDVLLEWRVIPPSPPASQHPVGLEMDRGSTPTSFSSAYTVTEHENESTSEESEASRPWSCQESEDELQGVPRAGGCSPPCPTPSSSEGDILNWGPVRSSHGVSDISCLPGTHVQLKVPGSIPDVMIRRRHSSGGSSSSSSSRSDCGESVVFNYIPCREQREKEDEEVWVANEAADLRHTLGTYHPTPSLLQEPGRCGSTWSSTERAAVWGQQLGRTHGCMLSPACVAELMCTLAPNITPPGQLGGVIPSRRHYSTRQRVAEVVDEEPKQSWNTQPMSDNLILQTSSNTNMPTKRFSFLIRSNSVKNNCGEKLKLPTREVTPSDQAILDKLATLNIEAPEVTQKPRTRCSLFDPPCIRCGEPVYPQERMEPTIRLVYHTSCFKCYQCGVRLTLKTFFRSPLDSKDVRVFCKSHTPSLDPGRVSTSRPEVTVCNKNSDVTSPPHTQPRTGTGTGTPNGTSHLVKDQINVVKCDTIGLRYF